MRIVKVNLQAELIKIFMPWRALGISGRGWRHNLLFLFSNAASPHNAALSLSMGVFLGIFPIYGFQMILLMALTPVMRLNWPLAFLGVNVTFAPLMPFFIAAGVAVGKLVVPVFPFKLPRIPLCFIAKGGMEWFVGSVVLAVVSAVLVYGISYPFFRLDARKKQLKIHDKQENINN
jgi:uncharacterized protein (DUF2062 family)